MSDNLLPSSFMMLNEHLYEVFAQYIINGRIRAPPESELIELIPTFQLGAKTDRRALQSKFKSWAKRMNYEDGNLILSCSGKLIIPREKCDDIVMHFHSEEHHPVEIVISKIKMKYSWTRKNFGMDRDVVIESIAKNCGMEECMKRMRLEALRYSSSFCSSQTNSLQPPTPTYEPSFRFPPPMQCLPSPYPYRWPFPLQYAPVFAPNGIPVRIPYFNSIPNLEGMMTEYAKATFASMPDKNTSSISLKSNLDKETILEKEPVTGTIHSASNLNAQGNINSVKFKRPKNIREYKILLKAAHRNPKDFPDILGNEKTGFLSNVGLVPKSICSSKTLKRFRAELREKRFLNRECVIYRERKILRDKNKLIKSSKEKRNQLYLVVPKRSESAFIRPSKAALVSSQESRKTKDSLKDRRQRKRIRLSLQEPKQPIEVIDIASSDDETDKGNDIIIDQTILVSEAGNTPTSKNQLTATSNQSIESTAVVDTSIFEVGTKNTSENESQLTSTSNQKIQSTVVGVPCSISAAEGTIPISESSLTTSANRKIQSTVEESFVKFGKNQIQSENNPDIQSNKNHDNYPILTGNCNLFNGVETNECSWMPVLMPRNERNESVEEKSTNHSNVPAEERFRISHITKTYAGLRNVISVAKNANNYSFRPINPVLSGQRQENSSFVQSRAMLVPGNNNTTPRIVYPIPISQSLSTPNIFVVKKSEMGPFIVMPPFSRPIIPKPNSGCKTLSSVTSNGQISTATASTSFKLQHQGLTNAARTKILSQNSLVGNFSKKNENTAKVNIEEEMIRIASWIYRMRSAINPTMFQQGLEKSVKKMMSQLDVGIYLVREARKALMEIEE